MPIHCLSLHPCNACVETVESTPSSTVSRSSHSASRVISRRAGSPSSVFGGLYAVLRTMRTLRTSSKTLNAGVSVTCGLGAESPEGGPGRTGRGGDEAYPIPARSPPIQDSKPGPGPPSLPLPSLPGPGPPSLPLPGPGPPSLPLPSLPGPGPPSLPLPDPGPPSLPGVSLVPARRPSLCPVRGRLLGTCVGDAVIPASRPAPPGPG